MPCVAPGTVIWAAACDLLQWGGMLQDHNDVKLPCHLLLAKLAAVAPGQLLAALDRIVDPLDKTLTARLKTDAVKQEVRSMTQRRSQAPALPHRTRGSRRFTLLAYVLFWPTQATPSTDPRMSCVTGGPQRGHDKECS
jgi:hypothetical protein